MVAHSLDLGIVIVVSHSRVPLSQNSLCPSVYSSFSLPTTPGNHWTRYYFLSLSFLKYYRVWIIQYIHYSFIHVNEPFQLTSFPNNGFPLTLDSCWAHGSSCFFTYFGMSWGLGLPAPPARHQAHVMLTPIPAFHLASIKFRTRTQKWEGSHRVQPCYYLNEKNEPEHFLGGWGRQAWALSTAYVADVMYKLNI